MAKSLHLNLDDAWEGEIAGLRLLDARSWGPRLRFSARPREIENFYREFRPRLAPFLLFGSGDFHHLSALWIRQILEPFTLVSFDNHPDWDLRPPRWCCGGWVNRALDLSTTRRVSVWGCGNFECWWPGQLFGNRHAEQVGRLEVHPWADDRSPREQKRRGAIFRGTWRERFAAFVADLAGGNVYVTIDLDCLQKSDAVTNWENGRFTLDDVAWALEFLRSKLRVIAGDICGAFSEPTYARATQRFVAEIDHPKLPPTNPAETREINRAALAKLWPILTE